MADWRGRPVTCLAVEHLGLADLKPFLPAAGAPGLVADSRATAVHETAAPSTTVLAVDAAGSSYGLPAASIVELLEDAVITRLPLAPPFLTGVAILRRQPVLVFSLARLLGGEPTATSGGHVVVAIGRSRFVLAVDAIGGLQRLSDDRRGSIAGRHPTSPPRSGGAPHAQMACSGGGNVRDGCRADSRRHRPSAIPLRDAGR